MSNKERFDKLTNTYSDDKEKKIDEIIKLNNKVCKKISRNENLKSFVCILEFVMLISVIALCGVNIATSIIRTKKFITYDECVNVNNKTYCRIENK